MENVIDTQDFRDYYLISIEGTFTSQNVKEILKAAECGLKMNRKMLLFDLRNTSIMDSNGIGFLINLHKKLLPKGGKVSLVCYPNSSVYKAIESSSLHKVLEVLEIFDTIDDVESAYRGKVTRDDRGFYTFIKLPQEFNLEIVKSLRDTINEAIERGYKHFVFSLEDTNQITSVGVGILMNLYKKLQEKGGGVYLLNISQNIRHLLEATNVLHMLPEYKTIDEIEHKLL